MTEATALIGTRESLQRDDRRGSGADPLFVELPQGFVLVPLDEDAWRVIGSALTDDDEVAASLSRLLAVMLGAAGLRQDVPGSVAYLELDQFHQSGWVALDGTVVEALVTDFDGSQLLTPETDWAFNRLLRRLGVRAGDGTDECTAVGLTEYLGEQA
ncbi:hypothetical protein ACEZCY_22650 [Streptacidiphilus sp. N1-12]|uniref:Uncharacterized protein n=2 Tax=Streptacidiphilus alkalitolerans TaxID=3342712 RepID=A0ABV6VET3_9ACTN